MSQGSPRLLLALLNIKLFHLYEVSGVKWIPPFIENGSETIAIIGY